MKDFRQGLEFIVKGVDRTKKAFEPGIDKVLAVAAANAAVVYEASNIIDNSDFSDPTNALIMMGTGGLLVAGNYLALLSPNTMPVRDLLRKANLSVDNFRLLSWVKTGALATALVIFGSELKPYTDQVMEDIFPKTRQELTEPSGEKEYTAEPLSKVIPLSPQVNIQPSTQVSRNRPAYYNSLGYSPIVEHNFSGTRLADKNSMTGRVQRTLRWQPIYRTIEQKYRMPRDTLGGMIMEESYGDPVQPNASNDGGLGLTHIQGTTGPNYGLKIFGSSSKDRSKNILVFTTEGGFFTLYDFGRFLKASDFNIETAMNLDGGYEAQMCISTPSLRYTTYGQFETQGPDKDISIPNARIGIPTAIGIFPRK